MQNRKRDTDVENRFLDSVGEGEGGMMCLLSFLKNIYLGAQGLSCSTQDLQSWLQHAGSLVVACELLVACEI